MITEKTIEIAKKAAEGYLEENRVYTSKEVQYGFAQRVIELALREALEAVDRADLKKMTYTTYDRDMLGFCKAQVKKEINSLIPK
jgi:hypothetical protein